jgi:O-glycosyl hydrolase
MYRCISLAVVLVVFTARPVQAATATIDTTKTYQTIEGLGEAVALIAATYALGPNQFSAQTAL